MIQYKCTKCGATLESPSSMAGQKDQCPLCKHACIVPLRKKRMALLVTSFVLGGLVLVIGLAVMLAHSARGPGSGTDGSTEAQLATPPVAQMQEVYSSRRGNFTFGVPPGWTPLPRQHAKARQQEIEKQLGRSLSSELDAVFQKVGAEPFSLPHIQVNILQHGGKLSEEAFKQKYSQSAEGIRPGTVEEDIVRRGLVTVLKTGRPSYVPEKHMALNKGLINLAGVGHVTTVMALFLGRNDIIIISLLSSPGEEEANSASLQHILETFRFEAGYKSPGPGQRENFWDQLLVDFAVHGTISAVFVLVILASLAYGYLKKRSKATRNRGSE